MQSRTQLVARGFDSPPPPPTPPLPPLVFSVLSFPRHAGGGHVIDACTHVHKVHLCERRGKSRDDVNDPTTAVGFQSSIFLSFALSFSFSHTHTFHCFSSFCSQLLCCHADGYVMFLSGSHNRVILFLFFFSASFQSPYRRNRKTNCSRSPSERKEMILPNPRLGHPVHPKVPFAFIRPRVDARNICATDRWGRLGRRSTEAARRDNDTIASGNAIIIFR